VFIETVSFYFNIQIFNTLITLNLAHIYIEGINNSITLKKIILFKIKLAIHKYIIESQRK